MNKPALIKSLLIGALVSVWFVVLVTVVGELYAPLKKWLADYHFHHWIGKSIWSVLVFIGVSGGAYWQKRGRTDLDPVFSLNLLSYSLIAGTVILYLFFTYHYLFGSH